MAVALFGTTVAPSFLGHLGSMEARERKCLLISWLQSPSAVILEHKKIKSLTVSIVSPSFFAMK